MIKFVLKSIEKYTEYSQEIKDFYIIINKITVGECTISTEYTENEVLWTYISCIWLYDEYQDKKLEIEVLKNIISQYGSVYICEDNITHSEIIKKLGEHLDYYKIPKNLSCEPDNSGDMYYIENF